MHYFNANLLSKVPVKAHWESANILWSNDKKLVRLQYFFDSKCTIVSVTYCVKCAVKCSFLRTCAVQSNHSNYQTGQCLGMSHKQGQVSWSPSNGKLLLLLSLSSNSTIWPQCTCVYTVIVASRRFTSHVDIISDTAGKLAVRTHLRHFRCDWLIPATFWERLKSLN